MPRPRLNDPLGVSDRPHCVTDPKRQAELVEEFKRRLAHINNSFEMSCRLLGDAKAYNASLDRVRRALLSPKPVGIRGDRVHIELELIIDHYARKFAAERIGEERAKVEYQDVKRAAEHAVHVIGPRVGRPKAEILRHHVEGLMALIQQFGGRPLLACRTRNSVYDPHFTDEMGKMIPHFFQRLDPQITETQLVNIVIAARRKYAGKRMAFRDFFPGYGATVSAQGEIKLALGLRLEQLEWAIPIYCP